MRTCLVGHSAEGLLSASAGGSERQIALLARGLARRGHDVALVVTGLAGGDRVVDGVRVVSAWHPDSGVRFLRAVTHRYPRLYRLLVTERADVYYARGAGYYTPFVVRAAHAAGAPCVLGLASDRDLEPSSGPFLFGVGGRRLSALVGPPAHAWFRRWGLRAADLIAVQNAEQAASCTSLGLPHAVLPNIVEPPGPRLIDCQPTRDVIWAGNVFAGRRSKGLDELAALAALVPDTTFTVAGTLASEAHRATVDRLRALRNVAVVGPLAHDDLQQAIAGHRLVVNTSPSEGFSNVMLEGWALGRPSVTLAVNPNGLLDGDRLGVCAQGDLVAMAAAIIALLEDRAVREAMGSRARAYVRETHAPERVCATFERLTGDLRGAGRRGTSSPQATP